MDIQKEREAFEEYIISKHKNRSPLILTQRIQHGFSENYIVQGVQDCWEAWQAAKAQAVPEGFVVCKSEPVAYIVQNKFWKQKFDVKSVKDMPPQKWEDDHYDVEIPLYAVSLDGLVLKEQDEDEAND